MHDLTEEHLTVGDLVLTIARPASPERLLDEEAFADDEFLPYWAELWPSGLALADYLSTLELGGLRVLELGCGLGVPSLAAAAAGAEVVASDWAPDAIGLLQRNAARNGLGVRAALLRWDDPAALAGDSFDLVLAADVLYEERNAEPLLALLDRAVGPRGAVLVADPGRRHAGAFLEAAAVVWLVEELPAERLRSGAIYRLQRR